MARESNYKLLLEKVALLEAMIGLIDDANKLVEVLTQVHGINRELESYQIVVYRQLADLVTFSEAMGT